MHKIVLALSLGFYFMHTQENSSKIRVSAEVLNIKRLEELKVAVPANTQDGEHIYITATREFHEVLTKHKLVNIRYLYREDGTSERIYNNKI